MASETNALSALAELTFDGMFPVPCETASYSWTIDQASRRYPYIDGESHDNTGRSSIKVTVLLHFLNTLTLETTVQLFPDLFTVWQKRLMDGEPALLRHPTLGEFKARVLEGSVSLIAQVRSGVSMQVTFVETLDPEETQAVFNARVSLDQAAEVATSNAKAVGVNYPTGVLGDVSLSDAIGSVAGQINSGITSATGAVNQVIGDVEGMISDCESIGATAWAATDALTAVWDELNALKDRAPVQLQQSVGSGVTSSDTYLDAIATATGNSLGDIMGLNPTLVRLPVVPRGIAYKFYTGSVQPTLRFTV